MHEKMADKSIEVVLDSCLEEILCAGRKVEECLAEYPEYASELKPLLQAAEASRCAANVTPREDFKARARYDFNAAVADMAHNRKKRWFNYAPVWAQLVAGALVAVMISGGAVVAASGNSLPGESLYGVKLAAEQVEMGFAFSKSAKSELNADLANRRVAEIVALAETEQTEGIRIAASRLDDNLDNIAVLNIKNATSGGVLPPETQEPLVTTPAPSDQHEGSVASYDEYLASLGTPIPEMFTVDSDDSELVSSLKIKGLAGYQDLVSSMEKAPDHIKPAIEEALVAFIRGYEVAIYNAGL